jgi:hypothetical protein
MSFVFQYGSNLSSARLNSSTRLCGDARLVGKAITRENYEFEFDIWSKADGGRAAADIIAGSGRKIWGVIYEIPEHLIRRETLGTRKSLDAIEGEGANYERIIIKLDWPDGRPVEESVITYTGLARKTGIQTTWDYAQHIITGLAEHDMPPEYRKYVVDRIIRSNPSLRPMVARFGLSELAYRRYVKCPVCQTELSARRLWYHCYSVHQRDLSAPEIFEIVASAKSIPLEKNGVFVKKKIAPKIESTPYSMRGWDAIREGIPRRSGPLGPGKG